jgi:lysyl-tRNA synthetase class 2
MENMPPAPKNSWQPSASIEQIKARAQLLKQLRHFFDERKVLEVSTPVLAEAGVTDPFIDNFHLDYGFGNTSSSHTLYLHTSPEYAMKRLLAAGCEHIYQIGPVFRHEGSGRLHSPEFTLLEWYRTGFSMQNLIDEVSELLQTTLRVQHVEQVTYQQVFLRFLKFDPLVANKEELLVAAKANNIDFYGDSESLDRDDLLQLLFSEVIEPEFAKQHPVIVSHFPASQAALATLCNDDKRVANRFEAYYKGIELANGFHELTHVKEQRQRFEQDNQKRLALGKPPMPIDERFLSALEAGLPDCAGVAIGVDRLQMLMTGAMHIRDVMAFY